MKWKALSVFSCLILLTGEPVFPESCALTHPGIILQLLRALKLTASVSQTVEHPSRQAGDGALIKYLAEFDLSIRTGLNVCDGAVLKIKCHMKWNEVEAPLDVKWLLIINSWFNHRPYNLPHEFPVFYVCLCSWVWVAVEVFLPVYSKQSAEHSYTRTRTDLPLGPWCSAGGRCEGSLPGLNLWVLSEPSPPLSPDRSPGLWGSPLTCKACKPHRTGNHNCCGSRALTL